MVITMAKLRMAHASRLDQNKPVISQIDDRMKQRRIKEDAEKDKTRSQEAKMLVKS